MQMFSFYFVFRTDVFMYLSTALLIMCLSDYLFYHDKKEERCDVKMERSYTCDMNNMKFELQCDKYVNSYAICEDYAY